MAPRPCSSQKNISYVKVKDIFMDEKDKKESKDKLYEVEIVERDQCDKH